MRTVRLGVTLAEVTPTVLRVLDVPAACTLPELHDLLQIAIGWTDSHLHQFVVPAAVSGDVGEAATAGGCGVGLRRARRTGCG